jgi:PEP-CTERM motif
MRLRSLILSAALLLILPILARADTMYTYTGNAFNIGVSDSNADPNGPVLAPFTTSDSISGWFTVASPLASNIAYSPLNAITVTGYSFSDGIDTFSSAIEPASYTQFIIQTDASGAIDQWRIVLQGGALNTQGEDNNLLTRNISGPYGTTTTDNGNIALYPAGFVEAYNVDTPGTWTDNAPSPSSVPEPSSLILLSTGALGLAASLRRRLAA